MFARCPRYVRGLEVRSGRRGAVTAELTAARARDASPGFPAALTLFDYDLRSDETTR